MSKRQAPLGFEAVESRVVLSGNGFGWRAMILPHMEQPVEQSAQVQEIVQKVHTDDDSGDQAIRQQIPSRISIFLCPSDPY